MQLEAASFRRRSASPSLPRSREAACKASAEDGERLAPGSIPANADSCEDYINIGIAHKAIQVQHAQIIAADSTPYRIFAEHTTNRSEFSLSRLCMMLLPVLPCRHVITGHCFESSRSAGAAQKGGYRVRDFWRGLHFSYV